MILPIGSPHNIILYTASHISFLSFCLILLPYIIVSIIFLVIMSFFIPKNNIHVPDMGETKIDRENFFKRVLLDIDYYLILTFIVLFILIGNLENIPIIHSLLSKGIVGNEVLFGIISSQIISNVPAAILLTTFSNNYPAIIVGINIGGLGTLIASMANLISFKILVKEFHNFRRKYLLIFTILNMILLLSLLCVYYLT
jgi:Na+/H+ antiporter NhaD/arsenite permease-like protein